MSGKGHEVEIFSHWLAEQPHKHKIVIPGNHDFLFEKKPDVARLLMNDGKNGVRVLIEQSAEVEGLKFFGSPWTPWFYDWAFNAQRGYEIQQHWAKIPREVDVLVTHGPPRKILDVCAIGSDGSVGCDDLLSKVCLVKPKIHVFGHIHGGRGDREFNGTHFYNATVVDEAYKIRYEPFVVDVEADNVTTG